MFRQLSLRFFVAKISIYSRCVFLCELRVFSRRRVATVRVCHEWESPHMHFSRGHIIYWEVRLMIPPTPSTTFNILGLVRRVT